VVARIENLTVRYGTFTALDGFTVEIPEGCVGLLGPNGAGKTTLIKTILGFLGTVQGRGEIFGYDIAKQGRLIRQCVGLMPEQDCHIPGMSAVTYVAYMGELAGMPSQQALRRAHEVLEYCGLGEARYRNVETYSTGMKQRIKLAQALVHGPKLLLLDEPTNGLDPAGREDLLDLVQSISHGKNVNVVVSSHLLPDVERVCDQVMVIVNGKLRKQGMIHDLKMIDGRQVDVELKEENPGFVSTIESKGGQVTPQSKTQFRISASGSPEDISRLVYTSAREAGAQIRGFEVAERSLEEAFMEVVNA
jgi:ABC-2 type transport system ATP-binding protein